MERLRFEDEKSIIEGLLYLLRRGVQRDELEEALIACGPVDLDLLAEVLRRTEGQLDDPEDAAA